MVKAKDYGAKGHGKQRACPFTKKVQRKAIKDGVVFSTWEVITCPDCGGKGWLPAS